MIKITREAEKVMNDDALNTFPDECCGFFFGTEDNSGRRTITTAIVVNNSKEGDKRRRFEISPRDYMKAEQFAASNDLQLLGVYHSHPNHPAVPSEHDRAAAQPFFSYIIISVSADGVKDSRSWRLNNDFQFEEEEIFTKQDQLNN